MKKKIVNVFLVMLLAVSMIWEGIGQFQKPAYILEAQYFADEWSDMPAASGYLGRV